MFFCTLKPQTNSTKFPDFTMERLFQSEMNVNYHLNKERTKLSEG